jgi:hypothetical protein
MKFLDRRTLRRAVLALLALSVCEVELLDAARAQANQGWDAVYNASMNTAPSQSFLDASQFLVTGEGRDLCDTIYGILTGQYLNKQTFIPGSVIDARGISGTTNLTCTHGSPWTEGGTTVSAPSTILLPAGTIVIPSGWIPPKSTRLIGEGDGIPSNGLTPGTTIQAASGFSGTMIQFGSTASTGIAVEHLTLDGQGQLGQSVNGIANAESQANSYVDHVSLYRILGTGLSVSGAANDSGPYSNITFDPGTAG